MIRATISTIWPGHDRFDKVVDHQLAFIARSLVNNGS